jgi:hypothetical protein
VLRQIGQRQFQLTKGGMKKFDSLSAQEIPALAISLEEEDERIYADFADGLHHSFPASAAVFDAMRAGETSHRQRRYRRGAKSKMRLPLRFKPVTSSAP